MGMHVVLSTLNSCIALFQNVCRYVYFAWHKEKQRDTCFSFVFSLIMDSSVNPGRNDLIVFLYSMDGGMYAMLCFWIILK